jgi:signal transduction histidine kinase
MTTESDCSPLDSTVCQHLNRSRGLAYARLGPDLIIIEASQNLSELVTATAHDVIGRPITDLFYEFVGAEDALRAILHGESSSYRLEWVNFVLPNGTTTYLTFEVAAYFESDPAAGLLVIIEDTTSHGVLEQVVMQDRNELRLAQAQLATANAELQRLLQFKSLMLSMASNEIRTPLTTIRLYTSLLLSNPAAASDEDRRRYIATIYGQANRLEELVIDLLDLDRIEAGRLILQRTPCDLSSLMREVAELMCTIAIPRRLTVTLDLPETPLIIQADQEHLRRVIYHLLYYLARHTQDGQPVQLRGLAGSDHIELQLTAPIAGLVDTQVALLFQPYQRAAGTSFSGSVDDGPGLFIAKHLVEAHAGRLAVTLQPEETTFTVYLPV